MKLTDKHLAVFKKHVEKWAPRLGLAGWHMAVDWATDTDVSALAYVRINAEARIATVYLCKDWTGSVYTVKDLEEVAVHELLHIVLADLLAVAETSAPKSMYNTIQGMEHNVIRTLENLIFRILK